MLKNSQTKIIMAGLDNKLIARSEARTFLREWKNFDEIILDFEKVKTIGPSFADEVFRVFKIKHPEIEIIPINMNETVEFMVKRVGKP